MSLHRRDVVKALLKDRKDLLVVAGLGSTAWDCTAAGDHDLTFPLWGAMGQAAMVGLGLALAQPQRRVLVITGDGEMLMGLSALAAIKVLAEKLPNVLPPADGVVLKERFRRALLGAESVQARAS